MTEYTFNLVTKSSTSSMKNAEFSARLVNTTVNYSSKNPKPTMTRFIRLWADCWEYAKVHPEPIPVLVDIALAVLETADETSEEKKYKKEIEILTILANGWSGSVKGLPEKSSSEKHLNEVYASFIKRLNEKDVVSEELHNAGPKFLDSVIIKFIVVKHYMILSRKYKSKVYHLLAQDDYSHSRLLKAKQVKMHPGAVKWGNCLVVRVPAPVPAAVATTTLTVNPGFEVDGIEMESLLYDYAILSQHHPGIHPQVNRMLNALSSKPWSTLVHKLLKSPEKQCELERTIDEFGKSVNVSKLRLVYPSAHDIMHKRRKVSAMAKLLMLVCTVFWLWLGWRSVDKLLF